MRSFRPLEAALLHPFPRLLSHPFSLLLLLSVFALLLRSSAETPFPFLGGAMSSVQLREILLAGNIEAEWHCPKGEWWKIISLSGEFPPLWSRIETLNHIWLRNTLRERLHYLPRGNRVLSLLPLHTTGVIQCYHAFCYKEGSNTVLSHEPLFRAEFPKHLRVWVCYYGLCGKQRICTQTVGARVYYVKLYYIGWILIYSPAKSDNYGRYIVRIPTESVLFSPTELPGFRHSRNHIYL